MYFIKNQVTQYVLVSVHQFVLFLAHNQHYKSDYPLPNGFMKQQ